jgi:hypothetical protein
VVYIHTLNPANSQAMGCKTWILCETYVLCVLLILDARNVVSGKLLLSDSAVFIELPLCLVATAHVTGL